MAGLNSQPSTLLILGVISFLGAVISTCTGIPRVRYGRTIYRAEEPSEFWWSSQYITSRLFSLLDSTCMRVNEQSNWVESPQCVLPIVGWPDAEITHHRFTERMG